MRNSQQSKCDHQSTNIVEVLQELHFPSVAVFHGEGRRFVEEVPSQCGRRVHTDEQVIHTSPSNASFENERIADGWRKTTERNTPEKDIALGQKTPFHGYDLTHDN